MCRIASLFLLQSLKGSMSGDARDFNNIETRAAIKVFSFPARQGAEGNSRHCDRNIRGTSTIVCHVKNLVAQFKRGDFSTCDAPRCHDRPPYSPYLAPSDYHLFPELKKQLKVRHFSSDADIIAAAETWFDGQISDFF